MSWDVIVFVLDAPPPAIADMPDDWTPPEFSNSLIRKTITEVHPGVDWSDPTWGVLEQDDWSIEFCVDKEPSSTSFTLLVRGGEGAFGAVTELLSRPGFYGIDTSAGEWLHLMEQPDAGFAGFRAFRDQVLSAANSPVQEPNGVFAALRNLLRL